MGVVICSRFGLFLVDWWFIALLRVWFICLCSLGGCWFWCRFSLGSIDLRLWWYFGVCNLLVFMVWRCCGYFGDVVRLECLLIVLMSFNFYFLC